MSFLAALGSGGAAGAGASAASGATGASTAASSALGTGAAGTGAGALGTAATPTGIATAAPTASQTAATVAPNSWGSFMQGANSGGGTGSLMDMYKAYQANDYTRMLGDAYTIGNESNKQNKAYQDMYSQYARR